MREFDRADIFGLLFAVCSVIAFQSATVLAVAIFGDSAGLGLCLAAAVSVGLMVPLFAALRGQLDTGVVVLALTLCAAIAGQDARHLWSQVADQPSLVPLAAERFALAVSQAVIALATLVQARRDRTAAPQLAP